MPFDAAEITDHFKFRLKATDEWRHVPSPTDDEIEKFSDAYRGAQRAAAGVTEAEADEDPEAYQAKLDKLTRAKRTQMSKEILEHVTEFCKGTPSAAELAEMGALERLGFAGWLIGVISPLL